MPVLLQKDMGCSEIRIGTLFEETIHYLSLIPSFFLQNFKVSLALTVEARKITSTWEPIFPMCQIKN